MSVSSTGFKDLPSRLIESSPSGSITVALTSDGSQVTVSARSEPYNETRHGRIRLDGTVPETLLKNLSVSVNGQDVSPPARDYAKFGDPHIGPSFGPLHIEQDSTGLIYIYVSGGDGGGAHAKRFVVSRSSWIRTEYRDPITFEYRAQANTVARQVP